jgi:hypothetical protein
VDKNLMAVLRSMSDDWCWQLERIRVATPISSFRAIARCEKSDGIFGNILTTGFPATTGSVLSGGGNAHIETKVTLP